MVILNKDYTNGRFSSSKTPNSQVFGHIHIQAGTLTQTNTTKLITLLRIRTQGNNLVFFLPEPFSKGVFVARFLLERFTENHILGVLRYANQFQMAASGEKLAAYFI